MVPPFVPSPMQQQRKQEPLSDIQCLTSTMQQMMQTMLNMQEEAKKNNENMAKQSENIARLAASLEKGTLPGQVVKNPNQGSSSNDQDPTRHCNAVTTLRSGKQFENPEPPLQYQSYEEEEQVENEDESQGFENLDAPDEVEPELKESEEEVPTLADPPPRQGKVAAPFPQRLTPPNKGKNFIEIGEVLRKVNINIPLLDAINQIPSYAKYLKDLCTVKRQLNVRKKSFAMEHVSTIAQCNAPLKLKDPGSPTITCVIGTKVINDALLDLGSSVNLMPYSVYLQLGLGEMKPTSVVLQLADRSMAKPRGFIEDVLVQVDKFYYPVDFVILDLKGAKPGKGSDLILGRPFLATCNAIINCRDGQLKLSFGNMKVELNIFRTCKFVPDLEEAEEVNCITTCVNEYFLDEFEKPLHAIDFENKELNEFHLQQVHQGGWATQNYNHRFEALPCDAPHVLPSSEKYPELELKQLPTSLKYAYLGSDQTFPVVISSSLTFEQETALIELLKTCKGAIGWNIADIKGINPLTCSHHIYLEENAKTTRESSTSVKPEVEGGCERGSAEIARCRNNLSY